MKVLWVSPLCLRGACSCVIYIYICNVCAMIKFIVYIRNVLPLIYVCVHERHYTHPCVYVHVYACTYICNKALTCIYVTLVLLQKVVKWFWRSLYVNYVLNPLFAWETWFHFLMFSLFKCTHDYGCGCSCWYKQKHVYVCCLCVYMGVGGCGFVIVLHLFCMYWLWSDECLYRCK